MQQIFRFVELLLFIRIELELEIFDRNYLTNQLKNNVKSFSIIVFVNNFELYRNMYQTLTEVYIIPTKLFLNKRQKSKNAHTITLSPYNSGFKDVINFF